MSGGDPIGDGHPGDDIVALALGEVTGERKAALAIHLLACPSCRQDHDAVAASVEGVLTAAPEVQPPIGFDGRALARMGVDTAPARRRPSVPWLAAAALVVVALAVAGALALRSGDGASSGSEVAVVATTSGGREVGTATVTEVDGRAVLVVGLTDAPDDVTYTCRMRFADGTTTETAPWDATAGAGWLVPLPPGRGPLTGIELVAPGTDDVWSTADLDG